MTEVDILIIGAGLSGLSLGRKLRASGKNFLIVEKSRGLGGRMATRRLNECFVDHGAPFLKPCAELFDLLSEFRIHEKKLDHDGVFITGGMTTISKALGEGLPILKDEKIIRISKSNSTWILKSESGNEYRVKTLIISSPMPQALELLNSSGVEYRLKDELSTITYSKALIGLFLTDEQALIKKELSEEVHSVLCMKDRDSSGNAYVLRMSPVFSENFFERSDEENLSRIQSFFLQSLHNHPSLIHSELKKWRYVAPQKVMPTPYLEVSNKLFLMGDSFQFPDIRGALLSAGALARKLI